MPLCIENKVSKANFEWMNEMHHPLYHINILFSVHYCFDNLFNFPHTQGPHRIMRNYDDKREK